MKWNKIKKSGEICASPEVGDIIYYVNNEMEHNRYAIVKRIEGRKLWGIFVDRKGSVREDGRETYVYIDEQPLYYG